MHRHSHIAWAVNFDDAIRRAQTANAHVLLCLTATPSCGGCARLDAEVYTDPQVVTFVQEHFVAVRIHVNEQRTEFIRLGASFGALWTPTALIVDAAGIEQHRIEGFLPSPYFLEQLTLGLAHSAFARGDFAGAERWYRDVATRFPDAESTPEALYWIGVSRYKQTGDVSALFETAAHFADQYQGTSWAKGIGLAALNPRIGSSHGNSQSVFCDQ